MIWIEKKAPAQELLRPLTGLETTSLSKEVQEKSVGPVSFEIVNETDRIWRHYELEYVLREFKPGFSPWMEMVSKYTLFEPACLKVITTLGHDFRMERVDLREEPWLTLKKRKVGDPFMLPERKANKHRHRFGYDQ